MFEGNALPSGPTTAVAVDREKSSQMAVKWAVESLLAGNPTITLVHVRVVTASTTQGYESSRSGDQKDPEADLFQSYRLFCAKKGMKLKEVVLEDSDVSKALLEYINSNYINNIVVGSSNRNVLTRKFRAADVPTTLLKAAPDFCSVYVICKGKALIVKAAKNQASNTPPPPPRQALIAAHTRQPSLSDSEDNIRSTATRGGWRGPLPPSDRRTPERMKTPPRDRPLSSAKSVPTNLFLESLDSSAARPPRSHDSFSDDLDFQGSSTSDFGDSLEFSSLTESPKSSTSPMASKDMEAEMKRLKLELKQTMDMYSTACKEALSAQQKAKELSQWKLEEARKFEEARQSEEAALAMVEMEKARARAAIEAAQASQRIAELEAKKRLHAELAAKREAEEKKKAIAALNHNDVRYRKYSIEEIEMATNNFAEVNKIGEGGYGPVYRACLDHTPVAVKILRPDAAQGKKQFQQEVEVLSCIRHPNMVLLLGACPEYGCLVYEYMDNGSLDDRLFRRGNTPPIPWRIRFKIAAEIATGLLFLHQSKPEPLVHRDLKPGNILLDRNYVSKISDVGLARLVPPSVADNVTQYRMTSTAGTFCYIDPEYQQTGMLGTKSDIYSFGVMLLQIATAKPPMGLTHHVERSIERGTFQDMLDPAVPDWPVEEALTFTKLALRCAELRRKDRPDLRTVILPELNRLRNFGQEWEGGRSSGWSSSSNNNNTSSSSGFGSTPHTYSNGVPRPWSQANQERMRSNPLQMGSSWKSTSDFQASGSSATS